MRKKMFTRSVPIFLLSFLLSFRSHPISALPSSYCISNVPYVQQGDKPWCGPASLAMILNFLGDNVTQEEIAFEVYNPSTRGTSTLDMAEYAKEEGFDASINYFTLERLKQLVSEGNPIIVLQQTSRSHYRVVIGYNEQKIITHDPSWGPYYNLSVETFVKRWKTRAVENCSLLISPRLFPKLDTIPPEIRITSPGNGSIIHSSRLTISWEGSDDNAGILYYKIKLDYGAWKYIKPSASASYTFRGVVDGDHVIYIKALDKEYNRNIVRVYLTVNTSPIGGPGWGDEIAILIPTLPVVVNIAALIYYFIKRKKK